MTSLTFLALAAAALTAYLLGGLPFGYWLVRLTSGKDIRTVGSGNIGATNVYRTTGNKAGLMVLLLDILKGFLAVWLAGFIGRGDPRSLAVGTVAVLLGHCYPVFLGFKGGKAVACFIGAFLYLAPIALGVITVIFVATVWRTKFISMGSLMGAATFPVVYWMVNHPPASLLIASIVSGALIIFRHKGNIERLRTGKENAFSFKGRSA